MKKNKIIILLIILLPILFLFLNRTLSQKEVDDVSPEISCDIGYLEKSDVLFVIPKYNNKSISDNKEWCDYILSLNKTLGLHGVCHDYEEFNQLRSQEYLQEGIKIFENCFGFKPELFKPPQLKISEENKELIKNNNLELKNKFNQLTHKVYHCNDTGKIKNWVISLF